MAILITSFILSPGKPDSYKRAFPKVQGLDKKPVLQGFVFSGLHRILRQLLDCYIRPLTPSERNLPSIVSRGQMIDALLEQTPFQQQKQVSSSRMTEVDKRLLTPPPIFCTYQSWVCFPEIPFAPDHSQRDEGQAELASSQVGLLLPGAKGPFTSCFSEWTCLLRGSYQIWNICVFVCG